MLRAFWQSVACSESGLEFPLLLPTIVTFSEIFTPLFLCKGKPAAIQLSTLPSACKNTLFVFMSIHSSWNLLVMIIKQYIHDQQVSLENLQVRLWVWHVNWSVRMLNNPARASPATSRLLLLPPAGQTKNPSDIPVAVKTWHPGFLESHRRTEIQRLLSSDFRAYWKHWIQHHISQLIYFSIRPHFPFKWTQKKLLFHMQCSEDI